MRTPEQLAAWLEARAGICTASRVPDLRAKLKNGNWAASRANYMRELLVERAADATVRHYVSPEMQWGIDHEDEAADMFEAVTGALLDDPCDFFELGIAKHPRIAGFSASPDRLLGRDGLVQIKCPTTATMMRWQMNNVVPEEHVDQMLAELACTERRYNVFVAYDPRIRDDRRKLFIKKLEPAPELIVACEADVQQFVDELEAAWDAYINATR